MLEDALCRVFSKWSKLVVGKSVELEMQSAIVAMASAFSTEETETEIETEVNRHETV